MCGARIFTGGDEGLKAFFGPFQQLETIQLKNPFELVQHSSTPQHSIAITIHNTIPTSKTWMAVQEFSQFARSQSDFRIQVSCSQEDWGNNFVQ